MDLEKFKERLVLIEQDIVQLQANFNLLEGAKRECTYWISKLESEEKEKSEEQEQVNA